MFSPIDYTFWALEVLAYAVTLILAVWSHSALRWYSVSLFCMVQVLINLALFLMFIKRNWPAYFYTQWYSEILFCALKLVILWQLILEGIAAMKMVPKPICRTFLASILVCGAVAFNFGLRGLQEGSDLPTRALILNRASSMAVVAIFSIFAIFSSFFGLKWKTRALQIDIGLNVIASVDLLSFLTETTWSEELYLAYHVQSFLHVVSLCLWCRAFVCSEVKPKSMTSEIRNTVRQMYSELP